MCVYICTFFMFTYIYFSHVLLHMIYILYIIYDILYKYIYCIYIYIVCLYTPNINVVERYTLRLGLFVVVLKNGIMGTSLMAQWLRIRLPVQGTWVRMLVQEDPACCRATKPTSHNYWAHVPQLLKPTSSRVHVLQLLKPVHLEPMLCNKRSHCNEKPVHCNKE